MRHFALTTASALVVLMAGAVMPVYVRKVHKTKPRWQD
jgi:hypothetical protein